MVFAFPSTDYGISMDHSAACDPDEKSFDETVGSHHDVSIGCIKQDPSHNTKIHRVSPTHLLLTSGLVGDSRTLASAFRRLVASWTHIQYGEVISVRELAKEIGMIRHGIGLRPGARVLGVVGVIAGLEDVYYVDETKVEVRMYKSLPGGTIDRCNICCTGGGADSSGRNARKETMEALTRILSLDSNESGVPIGKDDQERGLQRIIEEVGKAALKHHPSSNIDEGTAGNSNYEKTKGPAIDIWIVRAVSDSKQSDYEDAESGRSTNENDVEPAFLSPHRRLDDASMGLHYARGVRRDDLSRAVHSLATANV